MGGSGQGEGPGAAVAAQAPPFLPDPVGFERLGVVGDVRVAWRPQGARGSRDQQPNDQAGNQTYERPDGYTSWTKQRHELSPLTSPGGERRRGASAPWKSVYSSAVLGTWWSVITRNHHATRASRQASEHLTGLVAIDLVTHRDAVSVVDCHLRAGEHAAGSRRTGDQYPVAATERLHRPDTGGATHLGVALPHGVRCGPGVEPQIEAMLVAAVTWVKH